MAFIYLCVIIYVLLSYICVGSSTTDNLLEFRLCEISIRNRQFNELLKYIVIINIYVYICIYICVKKYMILFTPCTVRLLQTALYV